MDNCVKVSIAMATYNGEKYIKEQLDSILENINENDEIIISDDGSKDLTVELINRYKDKRIKLIQGPCMGVKKNFENAIKNTTGDIIFLADQDDIWEKNKIEKVLEIFNANADISLVVHDAKVFDSESDTVICESFFDYRKSGNGIFKNWFKNTYIGCCMAFRASLKNVILPIPDQIEMHDQWIGVMNEVKRGKTFFLKEVLLKYRRHSNNVSKMNHYPINKMIKNRLLFLKEMLKGIY